MSRPRLLDLFCGAGGAAMGYQTELARAAGFFDGEGSVHVTRDQRPGRRALLQVNIEQVDARPLQRFMRAVGLPENLSVRPPRGGSQAIHRVCLGHDKSVKAIRKIWPYLSGPKREQVIRCAREVDDAAAQIA